MDTETVVVAGAGPGLGASIAEAFAAEGCRVALLARTESFVESLAADLPTEGMGVQADLTDPDAIRDAFERVRAELGPVDVLVNHASGGAWKGLTDLSVEELDHALGVGVRGGFVCAQEAVGDMLDGGTDDTGGTVIFTGATSAVRGRGGALAFSAAKFGVRGMAESMARELGPEGVHVAHVVVDGGILPPDGDVDDTEAYLDPDEIAENYVHLVEQERSAWTLELDLRPHVEEF